MVKSSHASYTEIFVVLLSDSRLASVRKLCSVSNLLKAIAGWCHLLFFVLSNVMVLPFFGIVINPPNATIPSTDTACFVIQFELFSLWIKPSSVTILQFYLL